MEMGNEEHAVCPLFHHAIEVLGRRWSGAIIMVLVRRGTCRFNELLAGIPGMSDRLLSERLRELEAEGVVVRTVEPGPPVRVAYTLTDAGRALEPAIAALATWAERWVPAERVKTSA
jgi:DNA-binding HxlR family transcriptional regulator